MGGGIPDYLKWLPADLTAVVSRCEFFGRTMKAGFISGRHRSPKKGNSVEFAEHRQYMPGDDLRTLDWKVLGRKDKYYIRQYEEESNLRATILLDCSGSMAYAQKFDYARYLTAALAHLLTGQQDGVGLVTFDTKVRDYLPVRSSAGHLRHILETIDKLTPGGETDPAPVVNDIAERIPARGLVILISDLFTEDADALLKSLYHFGYRKHELVVLHVMDDHELTFDFDGNVRFENLEGSDEILLDAKAIRASYLAEMNAFLKKVGDGVLKTGADYVPMNTKVPYEQALVAYLARRRSGGV